MGWCSGTPIFDTVAKEILDDAEISQSKKERILTSLIEAMWDHDWDCESESDYYDHPLVRSILMKLRPDWFENEYDEEIED